MTFSEPHRPQVEGRVLAASPILQDPNFHQSLVYMVNHDAQGAMGLVMSRPTGQRLVDLASNFPTPTELAHLPVMFGGPVQQTNLILALFRSDPATGALTCHLEDDPEALARASRENGTTVMAFAGYAGWGEGQLEKELEEGAWKTFEAREELLDLRLAAGLWRFYIHDDHRWRSLLPHLPEDVTRN